MENSADEEPVTHLMNESFRRRYLVPNLKGSLTSGISSPALKLPSNAAEGSSEVQGTDSEDASDSKDTRQSTPEADTSERDDEPAIPQEADLNETSNEEDHVASEFEEEKKDTDQISDVVSEVCTVADSDVDDVHPIAWNSQSKLLGDFRYEISFCHYHLTKVEELWQPKDRQGSAWKEFEALRDAFFQDESLFFQSWVNLSQQVRWGWSWPSQPLHCAARLGLCSLVERLIAKGADASKLDAGESALDYAIQYYAKAKDDLVSNDNCLRLFEVLLRAGIDINVRGRNDDVKFLTFRFLLVQNPNIDAVRLFLRYGADAKAINDGSCISVLHTCVRFSDKPEVLEAILSADADPNTKDNGGETSLHSLMQRREVPRGFLEQLLDAKADVNEEDLASQRRSLEHL